MEPSARPATADTVNAAICGMPQFTRASTVASSKATPLPTSMKSFWHASTVDGPASKSLASYLSRTIVRPRMPPASLHHATNASAASNTSWLRPGTTEFPGSAIVPTTISSSVTPCSVAPDAPPGPHTPMRSPNEPGNGVASVVGGAVVSAGAVLAVGTLIAAVLGGAARLVWGTVDAS